MKNKILLSTLGAAMIAGSSILPAMAADNYKIDGMHSYVLFKIKHLNVGNQYGRFNKISGNVSLDEKNPAKTRINLTIDANSVDTGNAKRDKHLRSPDFFNTRQFPRITFKSTRVSKSGNNYRVTGNISFHGKTKPVTVLLKKTGQGKGMQGEWRMGAEATFNLKRSDFGVNYMPKGLSNNVSLMVSFEGIKK